ncbi:hypothetical protein [Chryseobacterium paridis]|uniref:Anti-sigma factor n=1 Tax=Chryseobacterium paridis TaxID=2800328 RepID=A0ABS1FWR1_9FLAO|nr:hypothetical protein [Chryseobacterium paridis]MBK1896849.1 hypothetical protein [Chryseobacterium paridis]
MRKEILKQLKSDYESIEIKPSNDLWDRIDHRLEEATDLPLKQPFQWWKYAAVVLLLISFGGYLYLDSKPAKDNRVVTKNDTSEKTLLPKKQANESEQLASEKVQNKNKITALNEKSDNATGPEKDIIKTYRKDLKLSHTIPVNEEEIIKEDLANVSHVQEKNNDQIVEKPTMIAAKKKASYIDADDLLLGREIDKTREENHNGNKKMGVVDMEKIKIKGPNSFKILGMTVFSDSSDTK